MTEPHHEASDNESDEPAATSDDTEAAPPEQEESVADPRVRDAVRRLNELADLPPAEHVEVYEAVHSSLQESLAEASRLADESPEDGSAPS